MREQTQYIDFTCDSEDCEVSVRVETTQSANHADMPVGWVKINLGERVYVDPDDYTEENPRLKTLNETGEFCSRMCAARFVTGITVGD